MRSERKAKARHIFEAAMEVPETAREGFLDQACSSDSALRSAVDRLIRADAEAGDFLLEPLARVAAPTSFLPPERIGPYLLGEKVGEGGMGVVYKATRDDEAFQRQVAIKLIVHHAMGREARRRLRGERQILAGLDHPWIAQIFDGGTTEQGVPYMVMEFVEGEPIDLYCQRLDLSLRQRIELFQKICVAVHCSHQNLVVHCDLKPSNILITAAGEPKLLDFGIAKLLPKEAGEPRGEPTTVGSRPLTPEYASPEQSRGEALSTISDVYSLGVLLYKLLTGERPVAPKSGSLGALTHEGVIPPSEAAATSTPQIARQLRGDLDAIVMKAMRTDPRDRFGSAEQFSEDLGRHLDGFPVLARQGTFRYRAKSFLRRHRLAMTLAAASLTVLCTFAFSMSALAGRLAQEKAKLEEVTDFFRVFFERAGPLVDLGRNLTLVEAVDQNAEMIEESLEDQPEVKVEIATILGDIFRDLGQPEKALAWSERASSLHRQVSGEDSTAFALSLIQVGAALRELGRYEEAESKTRTGLDWLQRNGKTPPVALIRGLNDWVELLCYQELFEEADEPSARARSLAEAHLGSTSLPTLRATANRSQVLRQLGHSDEAMALYEQTLGLYQGRFGETHPDIATVLLNLSSLQRDSGQLKLAEQSLDKSQDQYLNMLGKNHYHRVRPLIGLAGLASSQGQTDKAFALYEEAIRVGTSFEASSYFALRAASSFGRFLLTSDRCGEGEEVLRDTLEGTKKDASSAEFYSEVEGLLGECVAKLEESTEAQILMESK